MIKTYLSFLVVVLNTFIVLFAQQSRGFPYKNPTLPVETRVADLLSRMTLEEKVGQLLCPLGWEMYKIKGNDVLPSDKFKHGQPIVPIRGQRKH